jgi:outer membrane protein assembly factor BamA
MTEGPQYRMGTFVVSDASPTVGERLTKGWRLKTGDVYNAAYVAEFRNKDVITALQGVPTRISKFKMVTDVNRYLHVVNVTLQTE